MPNRAYLNVWIKGFAETNLLSNFEHFLATVPLSAGPLKFSDLTIRAVDFAETEILEHDLRGGELTPAEIVEIAKEHLADDVAIEITANWDLWSRDLETASWKSKPEKVLISCYGPAFDGRLSRESGDIQVDLGFEHFFTGHAGLLVPDSAQVAEPQHPEEARFLMWMSQPQNLRVYQEKTRENIQKLMGWMRAVEEAVPAERLRPWSEGEENFEARLDEILSVR